MSESQVPAQADLNKVLTIHRVMYSQLSMIELFAEEYEGVKFLLNWLKSTFDRDVKFEVPKGTSELDLRKMHHDNYATIAHMISTRSKFKFMDMAPVVEAIAFAQAMTKSIKAEIEKIEPPKEEAKAPLVMDLTHVTSEPQPEAQI